MSTSREQFALYRYFDRNGRLLYIGISGGLSNRVSGHIAKSRWMQLAASSTIERYGTLTEVKAAEVAAIKAEHPLFNRQHNDTSEARNRLHAYLVEVGRQDLIPASPRRTGGRRRAAAEGANRDCMCGRWILGSDTGAKLKIFCPVHEPSIKLPPEMADR
jgi:hypothetical protein